VKTCFVYLESSTSSPATPSLSTKAPVDRAASNNNENSMQSSTIRQATHDEVTIDDDDDESMFDEEEFETVNSRIKPCRFSTIHRE
jgi:hypothetical protein